MRSWLSAALQGQAPEAAHREQRRGSWACAGGAGYKAGRSQEAVVHRCLQPAPHVDGEDGMRAPAPDQHGAEKGGSKMVQQAPGAVCIDAAPARPLQAVQRGCGENQQAQRG